MRYYLAGKIWKNDWRSDPRILGNRGGAWDTEKCDCDSSDIVVTEGMGIPNLCGVKGAVYCGPYFISCDHGCFHGLESHGQINHYEPRGVYDWVARLKVVRKCEQWIRSSDIVFARLSPDNPSGTLIEIGMASALGKEIWIWFCDDESERIHWFANSINGAERLGFGDDETLAVRLQNRIILFEKEVGNSSMTYTELLSLPQWQKKRLEVLESNGWKCAQCGDASNQLHVHHNTYRKGAMPWDYPMENFQVLCRSCHAIRHGKIEVEK